MNMMLDIAKRYIDNCGDEAQAIETFAEDLMRDDPASFKSGYSYDNAIIATAEAFAVSRERVDAILSGDTDWDEH